MLLSFALPDSAIRSQSTDLIRVYKIQEFLYRIYLINHYPVSWCIRISSYSSSSVCKSAVNSLHFLLENFSCRRRSSLSNRSQFSSSFNCCTFRSSRLWKLEFLSIVKVKKYFLISEMQLNAIVNRYASPTTRYHSIHLWFDKILVVRLSKNSCQSVAVFYE